MGYARARIHRRLSRRQTARPPHYRRGCAERQRKPGRCRNRACAPCTAAKASQNGRFRSSPQLIERYPRNYLLRFELAQMYASIGERRNALDTLGEIARLKRENAPGYARIPWEKIYYETGNLQFWFDDLDHALENLQKVTATPGTAEGTRSEYRRAGADAAGTDLRYAEPAQPGDSGLSGRRSVLPRRPTRRVNPSTTSILPMSAPREAESVALAVLPAGSFH